MGIFSKKPNAGKIHAAKAGRFLADVQRESAKKNKQDEVAKQRAKKQRGKR
ncbi:hypothetical protein ACIBGM_45100 [Kribbella sp. NPDC050470]|uniref:hypothetical protein n=1 Tax=Kribbella sp. NPDC050470 TaxID=3364117 RepID=UPI0037B0E876